MHKVYQNSVLNLSASGAEDATEGFYFDRDPAEIGPHPLCPSFDDFDWRDLNRGRSGPSWHLVHEDLYGDVIQKTAAFKRAWVFQERQLSKRVLHFGKEQVFWECRSANCCELFPQGLPSRLMVSTSTLPKFVYKETRNPSSISSIIHKRLPMVSDRPAVVQMQMVWQALVTDYSKARLTYSSDKLIAISGMAQDVWTTWRGRLVNETRYIAGLWDSHLPETLLWKISEKEIAPRPKPYRAPTWSWASINGTVVWEDRIWTDEYTCETTILSVDVQYAWDDWGKVISGEIVANGPLRRLQYEDFRIGFIRLGPDKGEDTQHSVMLHDDESRWGPTEPWDEYLYGLLIVRFKDLSLRRCCMMVLNPLPDSDNAFERVGIGYPMFGAEVKEWFDGCPSQTVVIR